jgi:Zn-dependent peptidase ImmA (M78 family)/DNA-binding XRE family transcriptional regulator
MPFSPTRLGVARKRRRLTISRLAELSGISRQMISAYTHGTREPSSETLEMLADVLDVPVEFFTATDIDEIPEGAVSFRARTKLTATQRDGALSAGAIALLLARWIEDRFHLPDPDVPTLPKLRPEAAAEVVRARWGLGIRPVDNMLHLLEARGVRVFSLAEDFLDVDAFSAYWHGVPYIWLNTRKSGERGRFDAAHELGHLVLHSEDRSPSGPKEEEEANLFASNFLMPRRAVVAARLGHANADVILSAKRRWKVSAMALTHRLFEINLTTGWEYRQACVQLSRMGYRSKEPGGIPRESSQLLNKVFQAVRQDIGSMRKLAADLNLKPEELNEHVFGLAALAVDGGSFRSEPARPALHLVDGVNGSRARRRGEQT